MHLIPISQIIQPNDVHLRNLCLKRLLYAFNPILKRLLYDFILETDVANGSENLHFVTKFKTEYFLIPPLFK